MACVWKAPKSPFWMAQFTGCEGRRVNRSTKQLDQKKALTIADDWERAAMKARAGELTKAVILKTLGDMMERTTGEVLNVANVKDFFAGWLDSKSKTKAAPSTVKRYRPILDGFLSFIGERRAGASVASVTATEIERFRDLQIEQGKGASTAGYAVKVLSAVFSTAVKKQMMLLNPAKSVETEDADPEERKPFSDAQLKALVEVADDEWRGMILFGVHTGIRLNDAANLTQANIDLAGKTLTFIEQKTARRKRNDSKETTVRLHRDIIAWLQTRPLGVGLSPLFPSLHGKKSGSYGGLSNAFNRLMESANVKAPLGTAKTGKGRQFRKLGFHSLRHTLVSRFANEDVPSDVRKAVVGHSSDAIHRKYVHLDLTTQDRAIAKLRSVL